ncbi:MAG TPA: nitroreductase family protein [Spirochaetota bacterium]|nr:nitroreductase family protein [Spirochaetota bacterium]
MKLFVVDDVRCTRCGACVEECPARIITLADRRSLPETVPGGEERCITCGHCVAVCPHGALSLAAMPVENCPVITADPFNPDQAELFLRARRSIRAYKKQPVDRATIGRLVDMARHAPSGHNSQPLEWLVVHTGGETHRIVGLVIEWMRIILRDFPEQARAVHMDLIIAGWEMGVDAVLRGAPHLVVCHAPKDNMMARSAGAIALAYLELAAPTMGLGTCWAGFFDAALGFYPPLAEAIGLPGGHAGFGAVMLGHPRHRYHRLPLRNPATITWR